MTAHLQSTSSKPAASFSRAVVILITIVGLALSTLIALSMRDLQQQSLRQKLHNISSERIDLLRSEVLRSTEVLYSLRAVCETLPFNREQFRSIVASPLDRQPELAALEWIPRVTQSERPKFEAEATKATGSDFTFTQRNPQGLLTRAEPRPEYYPVYFLEPMASNKLAFGYDLASDPTRRAAIDLSASTGSLTATAPINLAQDNQFGFLVMLPVYEPAASPTHTLRGFVLAVFRTSDLVQPALASLTNEGLQGELIDTSKPNEVLYSTQSATTPSDDLAETRSFDMVGRSWTLRITPTARFTAANANTQPLIAFLTGGLITLLLAAYVHHAHRARFLAESASHAKSSFLSRMSHEIRSPLNAILGYAQVIQRDASLPTRLQNAAGTINSSGKHLLSLVDDLLDLSKIEAGHAQLQPNPFELHTFARSVVEMFDESCQAKGLVLTLKTPTPPVYVVADERKLRQILINLLSNAVKFTDAGRVSLTIECLEPQSYYPSYLFTVSDTGVGIPLDLQPVICDPFCQAPDGVKRGGTGLGLAITRSYVQQMGGELALTSFPQSSTTPEQHGSTFAFSLYLPYAAAPSAPNVPTTAPLALPPTPAELLNRLLRASELCARTDLKRLLTTLAELSPAHKTCADELRRKLERFEFADIHAALAQASLAVCP